MIAILKRNYRLITLGNIRVSIVMADGTRISDISGFTKKRPGRVQSRTQRTVDF